jgi:hypothetical protein
MFAGQGIFEQSAFENVYLRESLLDGCPPDAGLVANRPRNVAVQDARFRSIHSPNVQN